MKKNVRRLAIGSKHRRRRGSALVEFAITAPVVFTVIFASFEICRVNMVRHSMDNAAYEGARQGITPNATAQKSQAAAAQILDAVAVRGATITVSPTFITAATPQITVTIKAPVDQNSWCAPVFFAGRSLTSSCTLDREVSN